ncbi:dynein heavy chain 17, axonemal isoform X6 [Tachysurus ichikawai]
MRIKKDDMKKIDLGPDVSLQAHMLRNGVKRKTFLPLPEITNSFEKTAEAQCNCDTCTSRVNRPNPRNNTSSNTIVPHGVPSGSGKHST